MKCKRCGRQFNGRFCPSCGEPAARGGPGKGYKIAGIFFIGFGVLSIPIVAFPEFSQSVSSGIFNLVICIGCILLGLACLKRHKKLLEKMNFVNSIEPSLQEQHLPEKISPITVRVEYGKNRKATKQSNKKIVRSAYFISSPKSLAEIEEYVVLDTETTGLNQWKDKIIEISLVKYSHGEKVDEFSSFVNPMMPIPKQASSVNHITDSDVISAPSFSEIWTEIQRFFDGKVVIGHNVNFDLDMIESNMPSNAKALQVQYIDTISLSKKAFPGRSSYRLESLAKDFEISDSQDHRAAADVDLTVRLFEKCRSEIMLEYKKELAARKKERENKKAEKAATYGWSPLLECNFVFTGDFSHEREKLESLLETVGANKRDKVNGKTSYLVTGNLHDLPQWALERKYLKAKQLMQEGKNIKIITEEDYIKLLHDTLAIKRDAAD